MGLKLIMVCLQEEEWPSNKGRWQAVQLTSHLSPLSLQASAPTAERPALTAPFQCHGLPSPRAASPSPCRCFFFPQHRTLTRVPNLLLSALLTNPSPHRSVSFMGTQTLLYPWLSPEHLQQCAAERSCNAWHIVASRKSHTMNVWEILKICFSVIKMLPLQKNNLLTKQVKNKNCVY